MKIDANNCETATAKSHQQQVQQHQEQQQKEQQHQHKQQIANTTSFNNNNENVTIKSAAAATATKTTTTTTIKMTDERNTNNHNNNNNTNNKNNNNDRFVVEAAKILLKNGLNGTTTAAAATLLTAAAAAAATVINLPPPPPPLPTSTSKSTNLPSALFLTQTTAVVATTSIGCSINNGQSSKALGITTAASNPQQRSATTTKSKKAMSAATATSTTNEFLLTERLISGSPPSANAGGGGSDDGIKIENGGVIDYTVNSNNTANTLNLTTSSNSSKTKNSSTNDIGRHPISSTGQSFGGRLQFFKDGKFILELARSKDGEKGGWVSVPRKLFRAPLSATSSTITPTSTTSTTYPKNESSTSLSFSDDNSSIQSSPWQRDHCWKQSAPRYGISKEMSLYYKRSKQLTLTIIGLVASRKKRRRPFDSTSTPSWYSIIKLFDRKDKSLSMHVQSKEKSYRNDQGINLESASKALKSDNENNSEDDTCSTSSTSTLTGTDCIDGVVTAKKTSTTNSVSAELLPMESIKKEEVDMRESHMNYENLNSASDCSKQTPVERMNTSEDERVGDVSMAISKEEEDQSSKKLFNGDVQADKVTLTPPTQSSSSLGKVSTLKVVTSKEGAGEKRLKKLKTRAKLITIIQKLIDRVPTSVHSYLSKTPQHLMMSGNSGGATSNQNNSIMHKISPPSSSTSSAATSRLVELQYHQQHVSPRKRILREFEKVSLEDTGPTAVGGKRSRAKGNTATSGPKSSPQRVQSLGCAVLTSTSTSTATTSTTTNGGLNKNSLKSATSAATTSSTPTRLYSSYSIHSLLGGGNSSNSNASAATSGKQAIISNINYQHHNFTDPSYLRAMLASPQSPENNGAGGKSPSSNSTNKKRSPPYSSPLYDNHSRSPTVSTQIINDYGRRSPRDTPPETNYKIRFAADHITATSSSASQLQQQQQSFYSPYMMSPKYVPAPQTSMSPNSINSSNAPRSPRHSSAFSAHIPSSTNASASANIIPTRELSPARSATASPRESTPRTVPKKTASIRRQFASPNNAASPNERADQHQQQQERKTHLNTNSTGTAHHQHSYQRASPNPHAAHMSTASASPLHYYMYAPNTTGSSNSNTIGSASAGSTSAAAQANAAAAAAGAYIPTVIPPSYYHPYISTLAALRHNPMWMHHYPGTTPGVMPQHNPVSSQAASRLSSPFHNFPYNGVGAAAVAAAAAAASAFGGPIPQSHLSQVGLAHPMSAPSAIHHHAAGAYIGSTTLSPKLTDENSINTSTKQTTASSIYPSSIKDEHSSDVPLNLSKH